MKVRTCKCGFTGTEDQFVTGSNKCRGCRKRYMQDYYKLNRRKPRGLAIATARIDGPPARVNVDVPALLRELNETRILLAELHDRVREIWTTGAPYPKTALYDRVLLQLRRGA